MNRQDYQRRASVVMELDIVESTLEAGHREWARISGNNSQYTSPLLLYSFGLERLLKIALYLRRLSVSGKMPTSKEMIDFSHGILDLADALHDETGEGPQPELNNVCRSFVDSDREWYESDRMARELLVTLDAFATKGRYHHLDRTFGRKPKAKDADDLATALENAVADARGIQAPPEIAADLDAYYRAVGKEVVGLVRRYYRLVARLFLYDFLGPFGSQLSGGHLFDVARSKDGALAQYPED